jgi:ribosomal protein S12 methylthiotransferase accessory factor YcaO
MANRLLYFVIGDAQLNSGNGIYLHSLTGLRARLMGFRIANDWTLVISIHGSETRIADMAHVPASGQGAYTAAAIERMFSDAVYTRWRDEFGLVRVVLNACQVGAPFESTLIRALTRRGAGQLVQGLGNRCRPETRVMTLQEVVSGRTVAITTLRQFQRLPQSRQRAHRESLEQLNREWGYFGAPPVPDALVLEYYFNEEPRGGWPVVEVTHNRQSTGVPFYGRARHTDFLRVCDQGVGTLQQRRASVPPAPDGE